MDPLTTATIFATLVSLLADFKAQHSDAAATDFNAFAAWLAENRHDEIVALLQQNVKTTISIKALLHLDRDALKDRFERLDNLAATLASAIDGLGDLAATLRPDAKLSVQALAILRQYKECNASKLLEASTLSAAGPIFIFMDGNGGQLEYTEAQFVKDDIMTLVDIGLLRVVPNSQGQPMYTFTRPAAELVAGLGKPAG